MYTSGRWNITIVLIVSAMLSWAAKCVKINISTINSNSISLMNSIHPRKSLLIRFVELIKVANYKIHCMIWISASCCG